VVANCRRIRSIIRSLYLSITGEETILTKLEAELTALHQGNISGTVLTSTSQGGHSSAVAMLRESGPEVMEATI
jgi:hypothetical protein